jgi:hypothetical protein
LLKQAFNLVRWKGGVKSPDRLRHRVGSRSRWICRRWVRCATLRSNPFHLSARGPQRCGLKRCEPFWAAISRCCPGALVLPTAQRGSVFTEKPWCGPPLPCLFPFTVCLDPRATTAAEVPARLPQDFTTDAAWHSDQVITARLRGVWYAQILQLATFETLQTSVDWPSCPSPAGVLPTLSPTLAETVRGVPERLWHACAHEAWPRLKKHGTIRATGMPDPGPFFGMSSRPASYHSREVLSQR